MQLNFENIVMIKIKYSETKQVSALNNQFKKLKLFF